MLGLNGTLGLIDIEFHLVKFPKKVVGELKVSFINFIDKKNYLVLGIKGLAEFTKLNVSCDIINTFVTKLTVVKTLDGIVCIQAFLSLCSGLNVPYDKFLAEGLRYSLCKHGLACTGFTLDK